VLSSGNLKGLLKLLMRKVCTVECLALIAVLPAASKELNFESWNADQPSRFDSATLDDSSTKHLLNLQERLSEVQVRELIEANVTLVVP